MKPALPRLLVTQPLHARVLARLREVAEVEMNPGPDPWPEAERRARAARADEMAAGLGSSVLLACAARDDLAAGSVVGVTREDPPLHRRIWAVLPGGPPEGAPARQVPGRVPPGRAGADGSRGSAGRWSGMR